MASPKCRDYFVTINENAECYTQALDILKDLNYTLYAFIIHDKDLNYNEQTGEYEPKRIHKHFVVELKNPITFQSMLNKFKGAHIQVVKYKKAAYQYLLHESPLSKEKYNYKIDELISNNIEAVKNAIQQEEGLEIFSENQFLLYIAQGTRTAYQFTKRFGLNCYKQYWRSYSDMLELSKTDEEMQNDLQTIVDRLTIDNANQLFGDIEIVDGTNGTEQPR